MTVLEYINREIREWSNAYNDPAMKDLGSEIMSRLDVLRTMKRAIEDGEIDGLN